MFATAHDRPSTLRECARARARTFRARGAPDPPRRSPCLSSHYAGCFPGTRARSPRRAPARPHAIAPARPRRIARRAFFRRAGARTPARRVARRGRRPPPAIATPPHPPLRGSNTNRATQPPRFPLPASPSKPRWFAQHGALRGAHGHRRPRRVRLGLDDGQGGRRQGLAGAPGMSRRGPAAPGRSGPRAPPRLGTRTGRPGARPSTPTPAPFMPTYMYSHAPRPARRPDPQGGVTRAADGLRRGRQGVMSYGAVPCPTPSFMETPTATQTFMELDEESAKKVELIKEEAAEAAAHIVEDAEVEEELKPTVQILAAATESQSVVTKISAEMTALSPDDACDKLWAALHLPTPRAQRTAEGAAVRASLGRQVPRRRILDPRCRRRRGREGDRGGQVRPGIEATVTVVSPPPSSQEMDGVSNAAVEELEAKAADCHRHAPPRARDDAPQRVGAPLTGCYELDSRPPRAASTPSPTSSSRSTAPARRVVFEVNSGEVHLLTCSGAHAPFPGLRLLQGHGQVRRGVPHQHAPKCNATASSFGVCAHCRHHLRRHGQLKTACMLALPEGDRRHHLVQPPRRAELPMRLSIHKVTADAHEAHRVAYDEWVYAYNNASHACKVGAATATTTAWRSCSTTRTWTTSRRFPRWRATTSTASTSTPRTGARSSTPRTTRRARTSTSSSRRSRRTRTSRRARFSASPPSAWRPSLSRRSSSRRW